MVFTTTGSHTATQIYTNFTVKKSHPPTQSFTTTHGDIMTFFTVFFIFIFVFVIRLRSAPSGLLSPFSRPPFCNSILVNEDTLFPAKEFLRNLQKEEKSVIFLWSFFFKKTLTLRPQQTNTPPKQRLFVIVFVSTSGVVLPSFRSSSFQKSVFRGERIL